MSDSLVLTRAEFTQFQVQAQEDYRAYRQRANRDNAQLLQSQSDALKAEVYRGLDAINTRHEASAQEYLKTSEWQQRPSATSK